MSDRLYKVQWISVDDDYAEYDEGYEGPTPIPEPEGWREYSIEQFGEYKPFFLPSWARIYKSRSAAVARASLINSWGGYVEVVECTPRWQTLADAKNERARRRLHDKAQKLKAELAAVNAKAQALA